MLGLAPASSLSYSVELPRAGAEWHKCPTCWGALLSAASLPGMLAAFRPTPYCPQLPVLGSKVPRLMEAWQRLYVSVSACFCRCWAALCPTWWRPGSFSASMGL